MLQILLFNLAKKLHSLEFTCGKVNVVKEGFEGRNYLISDTGRLLAFTILRTDP